MIEWIKRLLPSSLFGRSLLILVTPLLLVQIVTTFIFFDRHWEKMIDRLAFGVAGEIALIADLIDEDDSNVRVARVADYANDHIDITVAYFRGTQLKRISALSDFDTGMGQALFTQVSRQVQRQSEINVEAGEKWIEVNIQLRGGVMSLLVPERRLYSSTGYIVLLWMLGTSVILLAIAVLFMRNQIRPIHRLAIAAERIGKGRDVPFFKEEGAREVRQAGRAFLEMRGRIDRQIAQRTAMLAGVSHDLRTPLTRMKLQVSMMPDSRDKTDLLADMDEMQRMVDAYLEFARGDSKEEPQRVDLRALMERLAETARRDGAVITVEGGVDASLMLRPVAIERCFANLIGNAVKYAPEVWVTLERDETAVTIYIDDRGPGVPVEMREEVFKPFVRGEQSRNSKTGGVGLGLPIAQDIIHSHGGEISLGDSPQGGLRVTVTLPV